MRPKAILNISVAVALVVTPSHMANADSNLQITEIWPGGLPGADATSDWFELTNFGDTPATGLSGTLFYDDNSDDPAAGDPLLGIDTIASGESVVYLVAWENPYNSLLDEAISAFRNMWQPIPGLQIGHVSFGSGLGTEGDAVNIFDGSALDSLTIDRAAYAHPAGEPSFVSEIDGTWVPRVAEVGVLGARLGNSPADNLAAGPPIASPGIVPEPGSVVLLGLGLLLCCATATRKRARLLGVLVTVVSLTSGQARAEAYLKITEIWPGALPGTEFTSDWFEVTNLGNSPATGLNGNLFFDDSSNDPTASDAMVGVDTIEPGESVIYLTTWEDGFNNILDDAVSAFRTMWQPSPSLQIGSVTLGSGFGGNGDAANIFSNNTAEAALIDRVEYAGPAMSVESLVANADGSWTGHLAQIGILGAYEGFQPADDSSPNPAIGSPGIVPEPTSSSLALLAAALLGCFAIRRRHT